MAIQETITIELAYVEPTDDYRVDLRQEKKRTTYSIQQAKDLALELLHAAETAEVALREEMEARGLRLAERRLVTAEGEAVL